MKALRIVTALLAVGCMTAIDITPALAQTAAPSRPMATQEQGHDRPHRRPDRPERRHRPERPERPDRPERRGRAERPNRPERRERAERPVRPETVQRSTRS